MFVLRIISEDKILRFINTLIIIVKSFYFSRPTIFLNLGKHWFIAVIDCGLQLNTKRKHIRPVLVDRITLLHEVGACCCCCDIPCDVGMLLVLCVREWSCPFRVSVL